MASNFRIPSPIPPPQPKIPKFKIALCQLLVTPDKERNIAHARKSIEDAARKGAKLAVLPEIWNCPLSLKNLSKYAEDIDAEAACPSISMLSEVALCNGITIVGGSIPELAGGQLFNTCCVFGPDGKLKAKHRKLHLFEFEVPGEVAFRESDFFTPGEEPTIVDTGAHLICYPGAFNMSTGELLWELMQRARAADNQLFVATCAPARDPNTSADYISWGHSGLVGPFGEIIARAGHEETTIIAEIDYSLIQFHRENLPLEVQRHGDVYKMVDVLGGNAQ